MGLLDSVMGAVGGALANQVGNSLGGALGVRSVGPVAPGRPRWSKGCWRR